MFGDESCDNEIATYGVIALPHQLVTDAQDVLASVKSRFGGSGESLHCKVLFRPENRGSSSWAHLNAEQVYALYEELFRAIRQLDVRIIVSYARIEKLPKLIGPMSANAPEYNPLDQMNPVPLKRKEVGVYCA